MDENGQDHGNVPSEKIGGGEDGDSSLALLRRARAGDDEALNKLVQRNLPPLRRWATGRLPNWARGFLSTDDLIQQSILQTLRRLDTFEPEHEGALQAYLRQALQNRIRDEIRHAWRTSQALTQTNPGAPEADPAPSPLEEVIGRESLERYDAALERLPAADREAIVLRIEMGLDYRALAETLGKPSPDSARMAVSRALVKLGRQMRRGE